MVQLLWKPIQWFLKKLKIELPSDPAIPVLGIHTKDLKAESWKGICTPMFIAELYTRAKRQRQPKCPLMDKEKVVCIYNHSALKRKEILVHATSETWGHYTKWNKPVTKKKKKKKSLYNSTYVRNSYELFLEVGTQSPHGRAQACLLQTEELVACHPHQPGQSPPLWKGVWRTKRPSPLPTQRLP